jgi:probable LLM family oxidoreductase
VVSVELGIYTFAELDVDAAGDRGEAAARRLRDLLEEIELADQVGLDVFGVGEHHRPDFAVSAPAVVLAAAAARTHRIRLTSAVSVLSSDDPVRVFQAFATLDLLSAGRAEIMVGRGSFTESFPLFGYDLADYDELFATKLDLLLRLRARERITWAGNRHRPAIDGCGVYPRPLQKTLPVWLAVGGNPGSAVRAGSLGLPMALAIIGGAPERFLPFVALHREAARRAGMAIPPPLGIHSHGFIADTSQQALDQSFPHVAATMNRIGRERGWRPLTRQDYVWESTLRGANFVGSPDAVTEKILWQHEMFQHQRFLVQLSVGPIPHAQVLHAIELFGTRVAPAVRRALRERAPGEAATPLPVGPGGAGQSPQRPDPPPTAAAGEPAAHA